MDRYQHDPSAKDATDSEDEEEQPKAAEVAKPVASKVEDVKIKSITEFLEPTTPIKPTTPFDLGLAGEPTPSQQSSAKRPRYDYEHFFSKADFDLI